MSWARVGGFRIVEHVCEALDVGSRNELETVLGGDRHAVNVSLAQKTRRGTTITAFA